jgi:hypothetical protein
MYIGGAFHKKIILIGNIFLDIHCSWIWPHANLLDESPPGLFLLKADGKLSLRWLR